MVNKGKITLTRLKERESLLSNNIKSLAKVCDDTFGSPSLFFHREAIKLCRSNKFLSEEHIRTIYAGLCAWGMHRMGKTSTKLEEYDTFMLTILEHRDQFEKFRYVKIEKLTREEFYEIIDKLADLVFSLRVSLSSVNLVANTKTVAHILPDLIPFMDRNYTLCFLLDRSANTQISLNPQNEKQYFRNVMELLFIFSHDESVLPHLSMHSNPWATSIPKIFDNCIIAYQNLQNGNYKTSENSKSEN